MSAVRRGIFVESKIKPSFKLRQERSMLLADGAGNDADLKSRSSALSSRMKLKLAARKTESPGVESFLFKPEEPLVWKAGQFLHYVLNHVATDDRGSDRWFTIASAPCERHVMLTTRFASKQGSTFKKTLKALKPGDTI